MTSVKQLWEAYALENDKTALYLETKKSSFPPNFKLQFNWTLVQLQPSVIDWNQTPEVAEIAFYYELMSMFAKNVSSIHTRIKNSDRPLANALSKFLKQLKEEAPSSELLALYGVYKAKVQSYMEIVDGSKEIASNFNEEAEAKLNELAKHFYKVKYMGKAFLYDVNNDEWTTYSDCKDHLGHIKVQVYNPDTGKMHTKNAFDAFKEWNGASRYDRVVFNPRHSGHFENNFNLWQGLQVTPEVGDADIQLWELLYRICDYNEDYFNYVQKWCAHLIQKPYELPGTAIGLSGPQGIGKNTFVETVGMLLSTPSMMNLMNNKDGSEHGRVLSTGAFGIFTSYDEVFGNFNALAANKLLLLLDEATWGGFHTQKARFKTAVTGKTITINDKHMKQLELINYRRFFILSNDPYYIGADEDDRRLLPLEYKAANRPSDEWMNTFYETRKNGKMLANLLYRLKNIDISDWQPMLALKKLEITTGAAIQQGSQADYMHWLSDLAENGECLMPGDKDAKEYRIPVCGEFVSDDDLRQSFQYVTNTPGIKGWNKPEFVEMRNKILGPSLQKRMSGSIKRGRRVPEQLELQNRINATRKWKTNIFVVAMDDADVVIDSPKVLELKNLQNKIIGL